MRFIECKGTPREIGRQQGAALRELIRQRRDEDVEPFAAKLRAERPDFDRERKEIHAHCRQYLAVLAPELLEEIDGTGEGAGITADDALWLSTYNSVMFSLGNARFALGGCSALAFARSPVGPFVFKTYDPMGSKDITTPAQRRAKAESENRWLYVVRAQYATGFTVLGIRMAGSIWTECGVNNHGLAFASASLHPRLYPQQARALPQHCLGTLAITRCRTTAEVRELLAKIPVYGKGYAMAFGDPSGDCIGVEKTAAFTGFNPPQDGVAFQTNHLRSPEMVRRGTEQDPKFWESKYHANSSNRVRRVEARLPQWKSATRFESLVDDLFHAGIEGDLIQNCAEMNHYWITTWGALVFPNTKEMWVAEGLPEEKQFQKWKL